MITTNDVINANTHTHPRVVRTCFAGRTLAVVVADPVVTRAAVEAGVGRGAVVDVDVTVLVRPAVDADTLVVAGRVDARRAVHARAARRVTALVHVVGAVPS